MVKYLLKRLVLMIITLFVIVSATFFLMNSMPGNPVRAQAKKLPEAGMYYTLKVLLKGI